MKITGTVISGEKVGRTIGFPTANLDVDLTENDLKLGIYVGQCEVADKKFDALIYFGPRHIFGENTNSFEVYLYDFEGDLYDQVITVDIGKFIRSPARPKSLTELQNLIESDKAQGLLILKHA